MLKCVDSSRAAPSVEPLLVDTTLKTALRIDFDDDDPELASLVTEARLWAEENELGLALITQTVTEKFRKFEGDLELRWPPVQSITSVTYLDADGASQTLATSVYELGHHLGIGHCRLKYNQTWPTTRDQRDAVTIVYVAGYGAAGTNVPKTIRQGLTAYVLWAYQGRLDDQLLTAAKRLLGPYSARR